MPHNNTPAPDVERRQSFIDWRLPLNWLIGIFFVISSGMISLGVAIANQTNKINTVVENNAQIMATQKESGARVDTLRDQLGEVKLTQALQSARISAVERTIDK